MIFHALALAYAKAHSNLLKKTTEDALKRQFKADEKIKELFEASKYIKTSKEILKSAKLRLDVGNPPGKNGSLGDAINWEALLYEVPIKEELHFVADDRDYYSVLNEDQPKDFLVNEWQKEQESDITFYRRLSQFFKLHYPDIKLASELEKEIEIKALANSNNFVSTHNAIGRLSKFGEFSVTQVNHLIEICLDNNQVCWIFSDEDVYEFYSNLVSSNKSKINEDLLEKIEKLIDEHSED